MLTSVNFAGYVNVERANAPGILDAITTAMSTLGLTTDSGGLAAEACWLRKRWCQRDGWREQRRCSSPATAAACCARRALCCTLNGAGVPRHFAEAATPFEGGRTDDQPLLVLQEIATELLNAAENQQDVEARQWVSTISSEDTRVSPHIWCR